MDLVVGRGSGDEKCRHNLNQVALAGCTRQDNSNRNYFVELVQVFVELVQVFGGQQRALLHTDFFYNPTEGKDYSGSIAQAVAVEQQPGLGAIVERWCSKEKNFTS